MDMLIFYQEKNIFFVIVSKFFFIYVRVTSTAWVLVEKYPVAQSLNGELINPWNRGRSVWNKLSLFCRVQTPAL